MDPRFREDDGFNAVIPPPSSFLPPAPSFLSDSSFLPFSVIPAQSLPST
jgi:hypothetical protein